ncbi:MAG: cytochrome c maturation protein CcmE [Bacteroidia bacterium]|nr:cytochrome c maturation protein CcmE [Bacteroidia bacterium]
MRLLIAALAIGLVLTLLLINLGEEMTIYTDFQTAASQPSKTFHVVAEWVDRENSYYDPSQDVFHFRAKDTLGTVRWVQYPDPKPINFDAAQRIVLIGHHQDTVFFAEKILMKCPSKYKEPSAQVSSSMARPE